jgi:endonuclease/exonuclease/phosphatase family metal-dependent hydrolase
MSYNIRYDNPADGPNAWSNRKSFLVEQVKTADPDILGVQESLPAQVEFLAASLTGYGRTGVGRDENGTGESTTIFFRMDRFEMIESRMFWLSETPDVMSQGWDAAIRRICTYVRLKDKKTGQAMLILNTHFDHVGVEARKNSAMVIVTKIRELNPSHEPVILMGDFNATPESEPLILLSTQLTDARRVAKTVSLPQAGSYNAFDVTKPADRLIDHIFVSGNLRVDKYQMLVASREGRYPSDHFPVMAEISRDPLR